MPANAASVIAITILLIVPPPVFAPLHFGVYPRYQPPRSLNMCRFAPWMLAEYTPSSLLLRMWGRQVCVLALAKTDIQQSGQRLSPHWTLVQFRFRGSIWIIPHPWAGERVAG